MTRMRLGNAAPLDEGAAVLLASSGAGSVATYVDFGVGKPLMECAMDVTAPVRGLWAAHSSEPPLWVASDDAMLAQVVAEHYSVEGRQVPVYTWDEDLHGEDAVSVSGGEEL